MIAVGIITAPRANPTLVRSFESYRAAGFDGLTTIFAEPDCKEMPASRVRVLVNRERKGNLRNWTLALSGLLITSEPWLMVCEDDIRWASGACEVLMRDLQAKWDQAGAISLYLPIHQSKVIEKQHGMPNLRPGYYACNLGLKSWGAQCMVFKRDWAEMLVQDKVWQSFLADPTRDKNVDAFVAEVLRQRNRQIMWRVPCLVDHTFGDGNSSLGYKEARPELKTRYFKGEAS